MFFGIENMNQRNSKFCNCRSHSFRYANEEKLTELFVPPENAIKVLHALKDEQDKGRELEVKVEKNASKVLFTNAVRASSSSISIRELGRVLYQNNIDIGQNRLFRQLRKENYLCKASSDHNLPTQ